MELTLQLKEYPFVLSLQNASGVTTTIDASPSIGGKDQGLRPMELLAGALAGCMSIDTLNILKKQRIEVSAYEVKIVAQRKDAVPAVFETIDLQFHADLNVPLDKLENAVRLSHEKYCSVSASLHPEIHITTSIHHLP
jgi:putative redox protein